MGTTDSNGHWFEDRYARAVAGETVMPWDPGSAWPLLTEWTQRKQLAGDGRTALVVGCGMGEDAEHLYRLGFEVVAFDIAPSAIAGVNRRRPTSAVSYILADLLDVPDHWRDSFDLVVEIQTIQSIPRSDQPRATRAVRTCVAAHGTLFAVAAIADYPENDGPPWPLTREEFTGLGSGFREKELGTFPDPDDPGVVRMRGVWGRD